MYNGGRNDDTCAKLAHGHNESALHADVRKARCQDRHENTDCASDQDDEKQADSKGYIVVVVGRSAAHVDRSTLRINTVPRKCKLNANRKGLAYTYSTPAWE